MSSSEPENNLWRKSLQRSSETGRCNEVSSQWTSKSLMSNVALSTIFAINASNLIQQNQFRNKWEANFIKIPRYFFCLSPIFSFYSWGQPSRSYLRFELQRTICISMFHADTLSLAPRKVCCYRAPANKKAQSLAFRKMETHEKNILAIFFSDIDSIFPVYLWL